MSKPFAVIKHWTGATIKIDVAAPELGIGTLDIQHDDGLFRVSAGLDENELRVLRDGIDKALVQIASYKNQQRHVHE